MAYAAFVSGRISLGGNDLDVSASYSSDTGLLSLRCDVRGESLTSLVDIVTDAALESFYSPNSQTQGPDASIVRRGRPPSGESEGKKAAVNKRSDGLSKTSMQRYILSSTPSPEETAMTTALQTIQLPGDCPLDPMWAASVAVRSQRYCVLGIKESSIDHILFAAGYADVSWTVVNGFCVEQYWWFV